MWLLIVDECASNFNMKMASINKAIEYQQYRKYNGATREEKKTYNSEYRRTFHKAKLRADDDGTLASVENLSVINLSGILHHNIEILNPIINIFIHILLLVIRYVYVIISVTNYLVTIKVPKLMLKIIYRHIFKKCVSMDKIQVQS